MSSTEEFKDAIILHIQDNKKFLEHNLQIFEILEGDLREKIEKALRIAVLSDRAFSSAKELIPPLNIIKRVTDKLTKIYATPPKRTAPVEVDDFLINWYEQNTNINTTFNEANRFFNAAKYAAMEPFLDNGRPSHRVLASHQFLPYNQSPINPLSVDAFIKFMGSVKKQDKGEIREVDLLFVYTENAFFAIDSEGDTHPEFMEENAGVNPLGIIPQTYINRSRHLLIPLPDSDMLTMGLLIPLMYTHLNFAIQFQSHSIFYGIDVEADNLEMNPDAFWHFKSDAEGKTPQIGNIKPEVDIAQVNEHIAELLRFWLETKNIRTQSAGTGDGSISGIALMIKEMDATLDRKEQIRYFQEAEIEYWNKLAVHHNFWVDTGLITGLPKFSSEFKINVEFAEPTPFETRREQIDNAKELLNNRLATHLKALSFIYPDMEKKELIELKEQIDQEEIEIEVTDAEELRPREDQDR